MIIADTDILIDYLRRRSPGVERIRLLIQDGDICTTAISCYEIASGASTDSESQNIRRLFADVPILPLEAESAQRAAGLRLALQRKGISIGMADSLIAGIALTANWALLTRNLRHFDRVDGLVLAPIH